MSQCVGEIRQNYDILRDCLFEPVLQGTRRHVTNASREKGGNRKRKQRLEDQSSRTVEEDDAEGLADFTNVRHLCLIVDYALKTTPHSTSQPSSSMGFPKICNSSRSQ